MNIIILAIVAYTAVPGPFYEQDNKPTITIFLDSTSEDYDIRRRSIIAKQELTRKNSNLVVEKFYIDNYWNIEFVEKVDKYLIKVPEIPCFKIGKSNWYKFEPGAFAASGIFTLNIYTICKFINYDDEMNIWLTEQNNLYSHVTFDSILLRTVYNKHPPKVPSIKYPDLVLFYKHLYYFECRQLFSIEEFDKIKSEELLKNLFYWERNTSNILSIRIDPFSKLQKTIEEDWMMP